MRKLMTIVMAVGLSGCLTQQAVDGVSEKVDDTIDAGRAAFCSKNLSVRAYEDFMKRHNKTALELRTWCNWGDQQLFGDNQ